MKSKELEPKIDHREMEISYVEKSLTPERQESGLAEGWTERFGNPARLEAKSGTGGLGGRDSEINMHPQGTTGKLVSATIIFGAMFCVGAIKLGLLATTIAFGIYGGVALAVGVLAYILDRRARNH